MSAGTGHQSHGIVVQMLVWHRILEWAQGVRVAAAAATPIEVAAEGRRCLARKKKKKMVSSDGRRSAFSLQMNWKRLAPILQPLPLLLMMLMLMLCSFPPVASGARYDYDTSTIVNKYIGARKSQEKEPRHHQHQQQQQQQQQHQQQRTNDARLMTKDAGGGGGGGGGEGGVEKEWGGNCENVMDLQSAVIRILNAHYEYDQAILVMHDSIETIRKDISQLRKKIDSVSHEVSWKSFAGRTSTDDGSSATVQGSVPEGASYPADSGVGVPLAFALSPPSLTVRLDNLTFIVDRQGHRLVQLDKRLRRMRHGSTAPLTGGHPEGQRPLKQTASGPGLEEKTTELDRERERLREREKELEKERERQKEREKELENERERQREAELERQRQREADVETERQRQRREELMILRCEREMELTRELTRKQREINANVQRKIQLVEKVMQENMQQQQRIQGDAPHNHLNSPQQLVNGACPNGFMRYLSSCYLFENVTANWVDAEKRCQALNHDAHLVSIDNDDEEEFLIKYRSYNNVRWSSRYLWIGANDMALEGRWSWVANGADIGYSNWRKGEPSNYRGEQHCAYLQTTDGGRAATAQRNSAAGGGGGESGRWDDWHCQSARINFACEIVVR